MPTDTNVPADDDGTSDAAPASAPTWWETISATSISAGARTPDSSSTLRLTAPTSSGWMPPPSSFHSLDFGTSLPTAGAEPGEAMKAAAAAAASVAGDAIEAAQSAADATLAAPPTTRASATSVVPASATEAAASARAMTDDTIRDARSAVAVDPTTVASVREAVTDGDRERTEALVAAERRRMRDAFSQVSTSAGARVQSAREAIRPGAVPSGVAVRPAASAGGPTNLAAGVASPPAVRPYDPGAIRSAVTDAIDDRSAPIRRAVEDPLAQVRATASDVVSPQREASTRRQSGIVIGIAIALGALMAFLVLGADFDAGPSETAGFAIGILFTAIAQVLVIVWAIVLVILWRLRNIPKTGWRPGRAIWITLLLSPVPLLVLQTALESM